MSDTKEVTTLVDEYQELQQELSLVLASLHALLEANNALPEDNLMGLLRLSSRSSERFRELNGRLEKL